MIPPQGAQPYVRLRSRFGTPRPPCPGERRALPVPARRSPRNSWTEFRVSSQVALRPAARTLRLPRLLASALHAFRSSQRRNALAGCRQRFRAGGEFPYLTESFRRKVFRKFPLNEVAREGAFWHVLPFCTAKQYRRKFRKDLSRKKTWAVAWHPSTHPRSAVLRGGFWFFPDSDLTLSAYPRDTARGQFSAHGHGDFAPDDVYIMLPGSMECAAR